MPISRPRWPLLVAAIAVSVFAVWMVSPRFAIDGPSLVDDWSAISRSPDQLEALARFENPEPERFRPSWIAWNYVQWHTFDAPTGLVGPNLWNLGRVLLFVLGMTFMTALMLPRARGLLQSAVYAGLAAMPAFTVLAVPKFARDFAWFGPQEPILLGSLALGGSLLWLAARTLVADQPVRGLRFAACAMAGALLWIVGVYHKEAALCALPLAAAAIYVDRSTLFRWHGLSSTRRYALVGLAAVAVLPLLHVAGVTADIALRGDLVYGAEVDSGEGILRGLRVLYGWSGEAMTLTARDLMYVAIALVVVAAGWRRRVDVLAVGALASGLLTIVFAAQSGVAVSRYYIPLLALFALAASLSLARFPDVVAGAGVLAVFFAFFPFTETRAEVRRWSDEEQQHAEIVKLVSDRERAGCTVAVEGLDLETGLALPVLVDLETATGSRTCAGVYLVLPPDVRPTLALVRACKPAALEPLAIGRLLGVYQCTRLREGAEAVVAARRFRSSATS